MLDGCSMSLAPIELGIVALGGEVFKLFLLQRDGDAPHDASVTL